ncbi:MAG: hypothetical protein K6F66_09290, partial [Pseudobutyrivibrio sp.]|nr:hypothetical protein [Pseudobutyrivibrio sp.]
MFYYHYFYELIFAMCKHIFGMDSFRLYMNGNALICAWPLSLAMHIIAERLREGKIVKKAEYLFYCGGMLVSCIALLPLNVVGGQLPISWMDNHFFGNGNAMGLAVALSVLVVDVLCELWYDKFSIKYMIAIYLLASCATGFKGTTGAILVGITWAVFIVESIILKKVHLSRALYAVGTTLGFILTYILVTAGLHSSGANNRATELTVSGTLGSNRVGQIFTKLGLDYMDLPWVIIAVILTVICIMGPCILAFGAFTCTKVKTLAKEGSIGDIFDWFAIGSVIIGVVGYVSFSVPGASQVYFVITNAAFIFYGAMRYIRVHRRELISYISFLFFGVGTAFLAIDVAYFCYDDYKQQQVYASEAGDRPDLVSADVMEAYLWLRDNTPEDAVVAVDRVSEELDYRNIYFYCSAFSERQCYLEGYDYSDITDKQIEAMESINDKFYSDNGKEATLAMDMSGVDYLVVTEMGHPDYQCSSPKLNLVFTNGEVSIYSYKSDGGVTSLDY